MEVVLDTVSLNHLLRAPRKRPGTSTWETSLDAPMKKQKLKLTLDTVGGLLNEWEKTCGEEVVGVVMSRWEELRGIVLVDRPPTLSSAASRKLRELGFDGTIDRLVLRLGLASKDHTVVSDDNDFWDPKSKTERGNPNAAVARFSREELGVAVTLLAPLLAKLGVK